MRYTGGCESRWAQVAGLTALSESLSVDGRSSLSLNLRAHSESHSIDGRSSLGMARSMDDLHELSSEWANSDGDDDGDADSNRSVSSMGGMDGGSPRSLHSFIGSAVSVPNLALGPPFLGERPARNWRDAAVGGRPRCRR